MILVLLKTYYLLYAHRRKDLAACELKLQEQAAQHKSREDSLLGQLCDAQQRHTDAVEMCEGKPKKNTQKTIFYY